jgi:hypothetical protein
VRNSDLNSGINLRRLLTAGVAAGVVFFLTDLVADELVVGAEIRAALHAIGKPEPQESAALVLYLLAFCCVFGIGLVWLYAAITPRFGPGPATAARAGLAAWFFFGAIDALGWAPFGFVPVRLYVIGNVAWVIQTLLAAEVGAWLYKEGTVTALHGQRIPDTP